MDETVAKALAWSDSGGTLPRLIIARDDAGKVIALRDVVQAAGNGGEVVVTLRPVRALSR